MPFWIRVGAEGYKHERTEFKDNIPVHLSLLFWWWPLNVDFTLRYLEQKTQHLPSCLFLQIQPSFLPPRSVLWIRSFLSAFRDDIVPPTNRQLSLIAANSACLEVCLVSIETARECALLKRRFDLLLAGGRQLLNPTEAVVCLSAERPTYGFKTVHNQRRLRKWFGGNYCTICSMCSNVL